MENRLQKINVGYKDYYNPYTNAVSTEIINFACEFKIQSFLDDTKNPLIAYLNGTRTLDRVYLERIIIQGARNLDSEMYSKLRRFYDVIHYNDTTIHLDFVVRALVKNENKDFVEGLFNEFIQIGSVYAKEFYSILAESIKTGDVSFDFTIAYIIKSYELLKSWAPIEPFEYVSYTF